MPTGPTNSSPSRALDCRDWVEFIDKRTHLMTPRGFQFGVLCVSPL